MRKWPKRAFLSIALSLLLLPTFALPSHASYQALRLDGNGWAEIADIDQAGLDMGLSDFMIEARIKTAYTSDYQMVINKYFLVGWHMFLYIISGRLSYTIEDSVAYVIGDDTGIVVADGRWHYVTIIFDRSGNAARYADGSVTGTVEAITTVSTTIDNAERVIIGANKNSTQNFRGLIDEVRVWNFGKDGLPTQESYEAYITWRAQGRNVFLDISEYSSNLWGLYADAVQTDLHDGAGTVAGLVVGKKYGYVTATPHTLDYQGGTLADDGVFTATHTTGTIASGDADDHVRRVGLVARWKFEGDYLDEGSNDNDLTEGGTGNVVGLGYTLKREKILSPFSVR